MRGVIAFVISGAMTPCLVEKVLVHKFFRAMCSTYMEKRVLKKELILVGLIGFTLVGCSDVTRVSYSVPPELMQVRMEAASLLEEANSIEETGATIGRGLITELETLAPQISSNSADIEKFKSYLSELEGLKSSDVDEIIEELKITNISERSGRAMDHEQEDVFEKLRTKGYM